MTDGPVINLADITLKPHGHGDNFQAQLGSISAPLGSKHLGARLVVVPPRKRAWPFHNHHANDELFYILEGEGTLRFGKDRHPLKPGDMAVCPTGGPETAHQIINTGAADLRYIAFSSMREPDIFEYPDSGKWGAFAGSAPGGDSAGRSFASFVDADAAVDYWKNETGDD